MTIRRVLAGSAIALLMPASLLLALESTSVADSATTTAETLAATTSSRQQASQSITVSALPQIVQQGRRTASADSAKAAVSAKISPNKPGRPVVLEVLEGATWRAVGKTKQTKRGEAVFTAATTSAGAPLTYRVTAQSYKGLAALTSTPVDTTQWVTPTWTDEFSGSTLAPVWNHRGQAYEAKSKRLCSKGSPKAVKVVGGTVRLSVIKDKSKKNKMCKAAKKGKKKAKYAYRLNGHIGTQGAFSFRYGVAAARMRLNQLRGQHASFWMQPEVGNFPGSPGHEIDVIEYFGDKHPQGGLTSFIHWYKGSKLIKTGSWIKDSKSFLANKKDSWSKNYHVFSVQWTPQVIIFRIDGQETWRTSARVSTSEQYPILSLLASDYEITEMKDSKLPQHMYVDWIRVWETPQP